MKRSVELGPVPADETCAQLGVTADYDKVAKAECKRFIGLLRRIYPTRPDACDFIVRGNPHDFGTYYEVAVTYEEGDGASEDFAFSLEGQLPPTWAEAEERAGTRDKPTRRLIVEIDVDRLGCPFPDGFGAKLGEGLAHHHEPGTCPPAEQVAVMTLRQIALEIQRRLEKDVPGLPLGANDTITNAKGETVATVRVEEHHG